MIRRSPTEYMVPHPSMGVHCATYTKSDQYVVTLWNPILMILFQHSNSMTMGLWFLYWWENYWFKLAWMVILRSKSNNNQWCSNFKTFCLFTWSIVVLYVTVLCKSKIDALQLCSKDINNEDIRGYYDIQGFYSCDQVFFHWLYTTSSIF